MLREIPQTSAQNTFSSPFTVLYTVTIPKIKLYSLFLRKFSRFKFQDISKNLDQTPFAKFSNLLNEQGLLPIFIEAEAVHPKYLNFFQIYTELFSQLEYQPMMTTQAITANRPIDHDIDARRSNQPMITEETIAPKSRNVTAGLQSQTQTTSVVSNPKKQH